MVCTKLDGFTEFDTLRTKICRQALDLPKFFSPIFQKVPFHQSFWLPKFTIRYILWPATTAKWHSYVSLILIHMPAHVSILNQESPLCRCVCVCLSPRAWITSDMIWTCVRFCCFWFHFTSLAIYTVDGRGLSHSAYQQL